MNAYDARKVLIYTEFARERENNSSQIVSHSASVEWITLADNKMKRYKDGIIWCDNRLSTRVCKLIVRN